MIKKFKINYVSHGNEIGNIHKPSATSSTTISETSSSRMKRNLSVEYICKSATRMKKLRENLIQKHTPASVISIDPIAAEIDDYLKLNVVCDDVLEFWRSSFYHLKRLAQIVLAMPVTSTSSEQVFSTMGLILNAKRTMLASEYVGKIHIIHNNYDLL